MSTPRFAARHAARLLLCLGATQVSAQPPAAQSAASTPSRSASAADPGDARALVPPPGYRSAFIGYRPLGEWRELQPGAWRDANDRVARIGGWRSYTREAHAPAAAASAAAPAAAASAARP
jgi:hypothetical protein